MAVMMKSRRSSIIVGIFICLFLGIMFRAIAVPLIKVARNNRGDPTNSPSKAASLSMNLRKPLPETTGLERHENENSVNSTGSISDGGGAVQSVAGTSTATTGIQKPNEDLTTEQDGGVAGAGDEAMKSADKSDNKDSARIINRDISIIRAAEHYDDHEDFTFSADEGLADVTRKFTTHPFVKSGSKWHELVKSYPVCMATQTSVDKIYWLVNLTEAWTGPLSVAIFVPDVEYELAKTGIEFLRRCSQAVRERVSFHFITDVAHPPVELLPASGGSINSLATTTADRGAAHPPSSISALDDLSFSCSSIHHTLAQLVNVSGSAEMMSWRESMIYPQQLLRNVARQGCPTPYITLVDVDMIPKQGLADELRVFLLERKDVKECHKCAFVVPVYEIANEAGSFPKSKTQLLDLVAKKMARQFHVTITKKNSGSSNLTKWESLGETQGVLEVAYDVAEFELQYEPIYVARANVPQFDERFEGFGCTRWTQAYEMLVSGYKFQLLDKAFLSHWGFQEGKTRPQWRHEQLRVNCGPRLSQFAKEFVAKYGQDPLNLTAHAAN